MSNDRQPVPPTRSSGTDDTLQVARCPELSRMATGTSPTSSISSTQAVRALVKQLAVLAVAEMTSAHGIIPTDRSGQVP